MRNLTILIKPSSSLCNMKCDYCFYRDEEKRRADSTRGIMSLEVAEALVKRAMEEAQESVSFVFQGGEPTLAGLSFFRRFLELERKYNLRGARVFHSIQTNGLLIDGEFADFLKENRFLVGLSVDGAENIHNAQRTPATRARLSK